MSGWRARYSNAIASSMPGSVSRMTVRVTAGRSWLREAWFATGKPVYRFVTRRILHWEDNEGQGPKP